MVLAAVAVAWGKLVAREFGGGGAGGGEGRGSGEEEAVEASRQAGTDAYSDN